MSTPTMSRMFEDFALLTMEEWRSTTLDELRKHGYDFSTTLGAVSDLQSCDVSKSTFAVRYSRAISGGVTLHELHVFVWEADGDGPDVLERHYRVRAEENL